MMVHRPFSSFGCVGICWNRCDSEGLYVNSDVSSPYCFNQKKKTISESLSIQLTSSLRSFKAIKSCYLLPHTCTPRVTAARALVQSRSNRDTRNRGGLTVDEWLPDLPRRSNKLIITVILIWCVSCPNHKGEQEKQSLRVNKTALRSFRGDDRFLLQYTASIF